jgi:ribosomal protein S1
MILIEHIRLKYPIDMIIIGVVTFHAPFGFFLNIGIEGVRGLVQIPTWHNFSNNQPFPAIGVQVEGKILDIVESSEIEIRVLPTKVGILEVL